MMNRQHRCLAACVVLVLAFAGVRADQAGEQFQCTLLLAPLHISAKPMSSGTWIRCQPMPSVCTCVLLITPTLRDCFPPTPSSFLLSSAPLMRNVHQLMPPTAAYTVSSASHLPAALPDWFMPLVPVAASSTSSAITTSATISTLSDSSTTSPSATGNGTASSPVLLSSVSGSYSSEQQRQTAAAALGLQPYSAPAADTVVITSADTNSSSVDLTSLDVAGSSFSSEQQRQEVAGLQVSLRV